MVSELASIRTERQKLKLLSLIILLHTIHFALRSRAIKTNVYANNAVACNYPPIQYNIIIIT